MLCHLQDTSEKLQVETYVWKNKDDPDLYGEWDFEVCNLIPYSSLLFLVCERFKSL